MLQNIGWCKKCKKAVLRTRLEAREHLASMIRHREYNQTLDRKGMQALNTYKCPYQKKGWHIGRDPKVLSIDFRRGRTVNLEKIEPKSLTKTPPKRRKVS